MRKLISQFGFYLLIPALAATATWASAVLVVSYSAGELGPRTPSYGFPLSWITVGYIQGCESATPLCFDYTVNWGLLILDLLLYSTMIFAISTIYIEASKAPFPSILAKQVNWRTMKTILILLFVTVAAAPVASGALLTHLPCVNCQPRDSLVMTSFGINSSTNVTLMLVNTGTTTVGLVNYEVQDSDGNQWWRIWLPPNETTGTWWSGPIIGPNSTGIAVITIGSSCGNCTYRGTAGVFNQFSAGSSYAVTVTTGRNTGLTFSIKV